MVEPGKNVRVNYVGTLNDGTEFDNSYTRGQTLDFTAGVGQMIEGFDKAVLQMNVGEKVSIKITPEEAYGEKTDEAIVSFPKTNFPENFEGVVGDRVSGQNDFGQPIDAVILEVNENDILLDFNHPLAGQELNFDIELVEIV
jgi:FKBP-type peptidyl-prolyl cis-trans isomerase 2